MVSMAEDHGQADSAAVDRFIVFAAYGELMLDFQLLELKLWQFLAMRLKRKTTIEQRDRKIEGWYGATLGRIYGGVKAQGHLTQSLIEELDGAVEARNYLAHHFLIEWAIVVPSPAVRDAALEELAKMSARLAALDEALTDHLRGQGFDLDESLASLDDQTRREIDALRPTRWPLGPPSAG
jgi:hypothetical protein